MTLDGQNGQRTRQRSCRVAVRLVLLVTLSSMGCATATIETLHVPDRRPPLARRDIVDPFPYERGPVRAGADSRRVSG